MSCRRGKASPNERTKRELWASCGGYCQRPSCRTLLFVESGERPSIAIGEIAHILGASDAGPRALNNMPQAARGAFENLIMLCPNCHTIVDRDEEQFPDATLLQWKAEHSRTVAEALGTPRFGTRSDARSWLEEQLLANENIHAEFGPDGDQKFDPESPLASVWKRKVVSQVIPRNRKILAALDMNSPLLTEHERRVREQLRQHVDDLEAFHIWGNASVRKRFPGKLNEVLRD